MKKIIFLIVTGILFSCNTKEPNTKSSLELSKQEKLFLQIAELQQQIENGNDEDAQVKAAETDLETATAELKALQEEGARLETKLARKRKEFEDESNAHADEVKQVGEFLIQADEIKQRLDELVQICDSKQEQVRETNLFIEQM